MINAMEVREDDEEFEKPRDLMFKELESRPAWTLCGAPVKIQARCR